MAFRLNVFLVVFTTLTLLVTYVAARVPCDVENCLQCNRRDQSWCITCVEGYRRRNKECVKVECLTKNCAKCNVEGVCETCVEGYHLDNGACEFTCTDSRCTKCTDIDVCTACAEGHILQKGLCMKQYCFQGICKVCSGFEASDCEDCPAGTTRNVNDWECVKDAPKPESSQECSGEGACEKATQSNQAEESGSTKVECKHENCQECNAQGACEKCVDGDKVGVSGNCLTSRSNVAFSSYTLLAGSVVVASTALFLI